MGGLGSVLSSVATPLQIAFFINSYFKSRADAREAEGKAQLAKAQAGLEAAGIDPYAMYSPDVINEKLTTPEGMEELAGLYPGDLRGDLESGKADPTSIGLELAHGVISDYLRYPESYPAKSGTATTSGTPTPYGNSFLGSEYVGDVAETGADIWDDPSRVLGVILGPGGVTGNIDWGGGTIKNLPGSDPAISVPNPWEDNNVFTGVSTGNPVIDAALRDILNQQVGGETKTTDVILGGVSEATGYPIDEVINILKKSGVVIPSTSSTTPTTTTTTTSNTGEVIPTDPTGGTTTIGVGDNGGDGFLDKILDWLGKNKDATDEEIRTAAETAGVKPEDIAKATGKSVGEVQGRWDAAGSDVLNTVNDGKSDVLETVNTGKSDVLNTVDDGKSDVLETVNVNAGDGGVEDIVLNTTKTQTDADAGTETQADLFSSLPPQYTMVTTSPGDLADIQYLYDIGGESIFAPQREKPDLRSPYNSYASGGRVGEFDIVAEALRLLRGN